MLNQLDTRAMRAMGKLLAWQAQTMVYEQAVLPNDVIDLSPLLRVWKPGKHEAGTVVTYGETPYRCTQTHDSTGNPDWSPDKAPALWAPYHATDAEHALPW